MKTVYACTYIEKCVEEDIYDGGCQPGTRQCLLSQKCNVVADNLATLFHRVGVYYGLDLDDVFIPAEEGEPITSFGYNRLEDSEGDTPIARQTEAWKKGQIKLYLADYDFSIEKRLVSPILLDEVKQSGIKFH